MKAVVDQPAAGSQLWGLWRLCRAVQGHLILLMVMMAIQEQLNRLCMPPAHSLLDHCCCAWKGLRPAIAGRSEPCLLVAWRVAVCRLQLQLKLPLSCLARMQIESAFISYQILALGQGAVPMQCP